MGISLQAFRKRLRALNFTNDQLYEIFKKLKATDEENPRAYEIVKCRPASQMILETD